MVSRSGPWWSRLGPVVALCVMSALALALWWAAFAQLGGSALRAGDVVVTGQVASCPRAVLGPGCTVAYTAPDGSETRQVISRPGLVGVAQGDVVPLHLASDGSVAVGGWRPWVDGGLLLVLALVVTSGAFAWFSRVLAQGDPRLGDEIDLRLDGANPGDTDLGDDGSGRLRAG